MIRSQHGGHQGASSHIVWIKIGLRMSTLCHAESTLCTLHASTRPYSLTWSRLTVACTSDKWAACTASRVSCRAACAASMAPSFLSLASALARTCLQNTSCRADVDGYMVLMCSAHGCEPRCSTQWLDLMLCTHGCLIVDCPSWNVAALLLVWVAYQKIHEVVTW